MCDITTIHEGMICFRVIFVQANGVAFSRKWSCFLLRLFCSSIQIQYLAALEDFGLLQVLLLLSV